MTAIVEKVGLDALLDALWQRAYTVIGPTVRSQSIVYDEVHSADDFPAGWVDVQEGGTFRLRRSGDDALFAHTVGHDSLKRFLFPPELRVWRARRAEDGTFEVDEPEPPPRYAFVGVRSCDLHAVAIQDRVFIGDRYVDPDYEARRRDAFFVAVNCGRAGGTCFCSSMDTGPRVTAGFDLALTEVLDERGHRFVVEVGSDRGAEVLDAIEHREADGEEQARARRRRRAGARVDGPHARRHGHPGPAAGERRAPALGRGRRSLPELRQLHAGLPDVLLQHRRGHHGPRGRRDRAHPAVGLLLHPRALLRERRQRTRSRALALPAVDDPQALDLDRPVRHLRLRRLRTVHHLVPGRHRHHRGGGSDPRQRPAGGRAWRTIEELLRRAAGA